VENKPANSLSMFQGKASKCYRDAAPAMIGTTGNRWQLDSKTLKINSMSRDQGYLTNKCENCKLY